MQQIVNLDGLQIILPAPDVPIFETQDTDGDVMESVYEPMTGKVYVRSGPYGTNLSLEQAFEFAVRLQALCVTQLDLQASGTIEG